MRTLKKNFIDRLAVQAEEAEVQGMEKLATVLTDCLEKNASHVREDNAIYSYSSSELKKDVEENIWNAFLRTADFYDFRHFNAVDVHEMIEKMAEEMIKETAVMAHVVDGVGAYEPVVAGEMPLTTAIEVDEE